MSSELDGLCCPLTLEVFEDPCTLVGDGHTYERASIQAWLDSGKLTSPTTGATLGLGGTRLVPNYAVKRTIAELAARGRLPPKGTSPRLATEVSQVTAAAEVACSHVESMTKKCKGSDDLRKIATVSSNHDAEIGELISQALDTVGADGVVEIEVFIFKQLQLPLV